MKWFDVYVMWKRSEATALLVGIVANAILLGWILRGMR